MSILLKSVLCLPYNISQIDESLNYKQFCVLKYTNNNKTTTVQDVVNDVATDVDVVAKIIRSSKAG